MIELKNISFSYGEKQILNNFNLAVNNGECICLSGQSGCGKTTVARLILGLENPDFGSVSAPEKISCVFQEDRLLAHLSLLKNVCLPRDKKDYPFAMEIIKQLGLSGNEKRKISELSGGMKRRAAIARAVCYGGDALILDEAFNGLDINNKKTAAEIIKREFTAKKKSVILISHIAEDAEILNAEIIKM